jgi:dephospho-CoA kinase
MTIGNKFQVIGLTGGIATGKSTVSGLLKEAGFEIIDADLISKQVSDEPSTLTAIRSKFGDEVFDEGGILNRDKLGAIIFKSKQKRKVLNAIMQKKVLWRMFTEFIRLKFTEKAGWVILDVPLLYETKLLEWVCYPIIVVNVEDEEVVKKRLMNRNQLTEQQALDRMRSQMPLKLKCEKADVVINNSGNFGELGTELKEKFQIIQDMLSGTESST